MSTINHRENSTNGTINETGEVTMEGTKTPQRRGKMAVLAAFAAVLIIIALGLALHVPDAAARGWLGGTLSSEEIMSQLTDRLDLSQDQIEAIRPLIEEKVQMRTALWNEGAPDRRAMRREMHRLWWDTEQKLGEILTEEQVDKYLDYRQEQRGWKKWGTARFGKMAGGMGKTPEQVMARLSSRLNLTEDQAAAAEPIIRESLEKKRAVFETYRGLGPSTRLAMREEMQAIGDETHEQLSTILDDEQMNELNAMKEERRMNCAGRGGF